MQVEHKTEKGTLLFRMIPNDGNPFNTGVNVKNPIPDGFEFIALTSEVSEEQAKMILGENKTILTSLMLLKSIMKKLNIQEPSILLFKNHEQNNI